VKEIQSAAQARHILDLATRAKWFEIKRLLHVSKDKPQIKINSGLKPLIKSIAVQPFDFNTHDHEIDLLPVLGPHVAASLSMWRIGLLLVNQRILCGGCRDAIQDAQSAISSLAEALKYAGLELSNDLVEEMISRGSWLVNSLASQNELSLWIESGRISRQCLFVLGMHRSGTSALTGMLVKAGFAPPLDLMPPSPKNPKGYWESLEIAKINDEFLALLNSHWSSSITLPHGWIYGDPARQWRSDLLRTIANMYEANKVPIIKDPRFAILAKGLTPWIQSGLMKYFFLVPIRHPIEVAYSLRKSNGLTISKSIRLWLKSLCEIEQATHGCHRLFINYEDLLADPEAMLAKCLIKISTGLVSEKIARLSVLSMSSSVKIEASGFIDPTLRHETPAFNDLLKLNGEDVGLDGLVNCSIRLYQDIIDARSDDDIRRQVEKHLSRNQ